MEVRFQFFFIVCVFTVSAVRCLTLRKDQAVVEPQMDDCDPSTIPVMPNFDMEKFSGQWFELAKTPTGYLRVSDGAWHIHHNASSARHASFLFAGRDDEQHCIRPVRGSMSAADEPPGLLRLTYHTYATRVQELVRVLFTDYVSLAVVYACVQEREGGAGCHAAGQVGGVWTRAPHVDLQVFERAAAFLERACVHRDTLAVKNLVGPCRVDDLDVDLEESDDFPAPDLCYQPVDVGSCGGSLQRFRFEPRERDCTGFSYGGCGGNKNNFLSLAECRSRCLPTSPQDPVCSTSAQCGFHCAPCCSEDAEGCVNCNCQLVVEEKFANCMRSSEMCPDECEVLHLYPGCNVCKCDAEKRVRDKIVSVCEEEKAVGNCNDNVERFFYNSNIDQCQTFQYSGCSGNNNNFKTYEECKSKCQVSDPYIQSGPVMERGLAVTSRSSLTIVTMAAAFLFLH